MEETEKSEKMYGFRTSPEERDRMYKAAAKPAYASRYHEEGLEARARMMLSSLMMR